MAEKRDFSVGAAAKFCGAWRDAGGTLEELNRLAEDSEGLGLILSVRRGLAEIRPITQSQSAIKQADFIIRVNRSVSPPYPGWVKEVMHPELEKTGPAEYDIATVQQWLHDEQVNGYVSGEVIYKHLKTDALLKDQLGLADLLAIQDKGIVFFHQHFAGKLVFGWKSVVRHHNGYFYVPDLFGDGDRVVVSWDWLDLDWHSNNPALRFAS